MYSYVVSFAKDHMLYSVGIDTKGTVAYISLGVWP